MRLSKIIVGLVILGVVAAGCGQGGKPQGAEPGSGGEGAAPKSKGTIAISVLTLTNPFFKVIADSLTAEAAKYGYDVLVTSGEFDVARQQNQIKDFIVKKVSVIVLCPCNSKSIGPAIQEANAAGIPVFTADIACLAEGAEVVSHIATDNYQGGRLAAKAMIEALNGKGKIAIIDYPEVESVILRTDGFEDEVNEANAKPDVNIEIVKKLSGGGVKDKSFKTGQDLIQANPDLSGIFAINDPSALGAIAALEEAGKLGQMVIIGFDGQPEGKQAIKDGKIYADPVQFPDRIGTQTVEAIMKHLAGEDVPKEILIPTELYYKADAEKDPEVAGN